MTTFRAWRYGPKGEAHLFENEADVPKGWKDSPQGKEDVDGARRALDIPPGRMDRAALPPALAVIADQVFTEAMARMPGPATADERPVYVPPSASADRIGEREGPKVIEDPVRGQGDSQPHIEAHNWTVADQARMLARQEKEAAEAIAARDANRTEESPAVRKIEQAFEPQEAEPLTLEEVRADPEVLTDDQKKALAEAKKEGIDPIADPLDHDSNGKKGGSLKGAESTRSKGAR